MYVNDILEFLKIKTQNKFTLESTLSKLSEITTQKVIKVGDQHRKFSIPELEKSTPVVLKKNFGIWLSHDDESVYLLLLDKNYLLKFSSSDFVEDLI